jgi:hypothetical protein
MRSQTKPFTVEKKKSRKARTEDQTDLGLFSVEPKTSEAVMRSPSFAAADRAFGRMVDPSDSRRSVEDPATSNELGSSGAVERTAAANRILPDLSWRDHSQAGKDDEASMALKPRALRRPKKQRRSPGTLRGPRTGTRRTVRPEASAIDSATKHKVDEIALLEPPMPLAGLGAGSVDKPGNEGSVRLGRRSRLSPREIRRAVARGATKITASWARDRKRR